MDIDELTVAQLKELRSLTGIVAKKRKAPTGRAVVVIDRGWILAGDMSLAADGYIRLERAIHVFRWESIGFAKMLEDWKSAKVDLRPIQPCEFPHESVIFRVPVEASWGLK